MNFDHKIFVWLSLSLYELQMACMCACMHSCMRACVHARLSACLCAIKHLCVTVGGGDVHGLIVDRKIPYTSEVSIFPREREILIFSTPHTLGSMMLQPLAVSNCHTPLFTSFTRERTLVHFVHSWTHPRSFVHSCVWQFFDLKRPQHHATSAFEGLKYSKSPSPSKNWNFWRVRVQRS